MIDWARHYDTIYDTLGVPATLTLDDTAADEFAITVIDKTADAKIGQAIEVNTVRPVAAVRMAELDGNGIALDDLDGSGLALNGKSYLVETHVVKPAPTGELLGEVYLVMTETDEVDDGDDRPAWVPAEWDIWIDLQRAFAEQDAAWISGTGIVAVDTLLGADANTENGVGTSIYAAENLTADGYVDNDFPAFIGAARTAVVSEATIAIKFKGWEAAGNIFPLELVSADGSDGLDIRFDAGLDIQAGSFSGSLEVPIENAANSGVASINVLAATITATRMEIAVNGSTAASGVMDSSDRPPGNPLVAALIYIQDYAAIQSIGIKTTPLPDTTGLSALSETP